MYVNGEIIVTMVNKLLQYYLEKFCQKNKFLIYTKKEK